MDYKKLYEEALERASRIKDDNTIATPQEVAESIFPELRESEDERIRKEIQDIVLSYRRNCVYEGTHHFDECLAWLEKQKINTEGDFARGYDCGYECCLNSHGAEWLEKQKEQKPVNWTELTWKDIVELEGIINNVHYEFRNGIGQESFGKEVLEKFCEYKGDEYLDEKEQKPISTEDMPYVADEHFFEREPADSFKYKLAEYMTKNCTTGEGPYGYSYNISSESILQMAKEELIKRGELKEQKHVEIHNPTDEEVESWKNELTEFKKFATKQAKENQLHISYTRDVMWENFCSELLSFVNSRKPVEWSEEDTEMYINVASSLRGYACGLENEEHKKHIKKGLDWLENRFKSLRPQKKEELPKWKPSEEQMQILRAVIDFAMGKQSVFYICHQPLLESLYNDLKKLMEDEK